MLGLPDRIEACLFDLDGVLTQTAKVHAAAWKQMFDEFLACRAEETGEPVRGVGEVRRVPGVPRGGTRGAVPGVRRAPRLRRLRGRQAALRRRRVVPRV